MKTMMVFCLALMLVSFMHQEKSRFSGLYAMEGRWGMATEKGTLYESWRKIGRDELKGISYKLNGSDTLVLEKISLVEKADGIFYIPVVEDQNNKQPVAFRLISASGNNYVFENKLHDFPQRIVYNIISADSIVARIEGMSKGRMTTSSFYYKRVK